MFKIFLCFCLAFSLSQLKLTSNSLHVELNCENDICSCKSLDAFNLDTVVKAINNYALGDSVLLACAYHQIAIRYYLDENPDYEKAILYNKNAIKLRKLNNDGWLWKSQLNIAFCYYALDNYAEALHYLEKAKDQAGNPKRSKDSIKIFNYLSQNYQEIGEFEKAVQFAKKSIGINADIDRVRGSLINYSEILIFTKDSLNLISAISCLDSLKSVFTVEEDSRRKYKIMNILGNAYYFSKQFNKAIEKYEQGFELIQYLPDKAAMLNNIGVNLIGQRKFDDANQYLRKSLKLKKEYFNSEYNYEYASNYENFGDYFLKLNLTDSALIHYQKALINITNNFRSEDIFQNLSPQDTTLFIYSNPDIIRILHLKAKAAYQYYKQNNKKKYLTLANQTYQTAFNFHDKLQKEISTENSRLFQAKNIVPYIENALKVAYQQQGNGQDVSEAAFRFMEKNKATVLLQSMNEADALQYATLPDSLLEQEKNLKIALAFHQQQKNEAIEYEDNIEAERIEKILFPERIQYDQLIKHLENNYPDYYRLKYQQNETQLAEVQYLLDEQSALLEYFIGDSSIYILSIQKNQSKLYQIKKPENWQQTIQEFQNCLKPKEVMKDEYTQKLFEAFTQNSYVLYQDLLQQPIADLNKSTTNIQIIPDAELNYIPFELLLTSEANITEVNYKDLPYLLKQKSISYAYSAALLLENVNTDEQTYTHDYAGFAPQYKNTDYDNLPFAEENVQRIAQLLKGNTYFKNEAIDKNFKSDIAQFKTFQLAMHGILNDDDPLSSKLIFANTGAKDYELHAYELYNMQIPAQLGVLSACETGIGKQAKGEGIMSLSRAFTYAGCNSLVMSLWNIEDESTADIVYSFFKYLKKGKAKDEALRQAKLDFLQNPSNDLKTHPIYWAGLVQSGNVSAVDFEKRNLSWIVILVLLGAGLGFWKYRSSVFQS